MTLNWTLILAAIGTLGWLLILREGLQRWSQNNVTRWTTSPEFQIHHFSRPLGRIRLVTVEWHDHIYCLAVDIQGAYVQLIDKYPKSETKV
jgi:hypothetical protein